MHISRIPFTSNNINNSNLYNKRSIAFSSSLLNSMPINNNDKANNKEEKNTKSKWFKLAGLGALLAAIMAKITSLFKRKVNPAEAMNNVKKLIKLLKPEDVETAKEFYPVLLKNKEALNLKQELINPIMNAINKENMPFMISEGVNLISSKMNAIKEYIISEAEDIPRLFKSLTEKNKNMFDFVTNNVKELHIETIEDIGMFLKLPHNKQEYILNVLVKLIKNAKELNLRTAERYVTISDSMTPECEHLIQQIADFSIPEGKAINKYSVLKMVNNNNKDCVIPLLKNLENSNYNTSQIQKILAVATKENMPAVMVISKHSDLLANLKINTESVRKLITNEDEAKVFDFLMEKQEFFNIQELADIKYCLKYIKTDKLQYFSDELIEFLKKNKDLLNFRVPDMIADGLKNADSSILDIVKSVTKYANELKNEKDMYIEYTALVGALNKDNIHKLPKLINLVKQNEDLQFSLTTIDDITALLSKIE